MGKVYDFEKLVEMHNLMKQIDNKRTQLENEYFKAERVTPELLAVEQNIDSLVVRYMKLASKAKLG